VAHSQCANTGALCVGIPTNQSHKEKTVNYYEELAKSSVPELEEELRSLRSTANTLPEVKGNPYTSSAYRSYRRSSWINECHELLEAKRAESVKAETTVDEDEAK
jgi:hypothetical protein